MLRCIGEQVLARLVDLAFELELLCNHDTVAAEGVLVMMMMIGVLGRVDYDGHSAPNVAGAKQNQAPHDERRP